MRSRVKQSDVARACGVSRTAVAFAFNSRLCSRLRPETRQRVIKVAKELGYRPHRYARVMRKGKTGVIAILQFGSPLPVAELRAFHVARAIQAQRYHLLSIHVRWYSEGIMDAVHAVLDAQPEGIILVGPTEHLTPTHVAELRDAAVPMVSLAGVRLEGVTQVRSDFRQGMSLLTEHVLGLGHRQLTLLVARRSRHGDEYHFWPAIEREEGFRQTVSQFASSQVDAEVVYDDSEQDAVLASYQGGKTAMQKLLPYRVRPEVVLCTNDSWAIGALAACAEANLRVPEDIAITGFDNDDVGQFVSPPLTTMAQQTEAMATTAVELLVDTIREGRASGSKDLIQMPCELVIRESCGAKLTRRRAASATVER